MKKPRRRVWRSAKGSRPQVRSSASAGAEGAVDAVGAVDAEGLVESFGVSVVVLPQAAREKRRVDARSRETIFFITFFLSLMAISIFFPISEGTMLE